jgi:hypothetical protein
VNTANARKTASTKSAISRMVIALPCFAMLGLSFAMQEIGEGW